MFSRVLFPALMEAGAGKQNAMVVIVVRRYAGLVVVASLGLLLSSPANQSPVVSALPKLPVLSHSFLAIPHRIA